MREAQNPSSGWLDSAKEMEYSFLAQWLGPLSQSPKIQLNLLVTADNTFLLKYWLTGSAFFCSKLCFRGPRSPKVQRITKVHEHSLGKVVLGTVNPLDIFLRLLEYLFTNSFKPLLQP